jgi:hypothetical protein
MLPVAVASSLIRVWSKAMLDPGWQLTLKSNSRHSYRQVLPVRGQCWLWCSADPPLLFYRAMSTAAQNPMITIVVDHFARGDKPIDIFGDTPGAEIQTGLLVLLEDGASIHHNIAAADSREFLEWFREALNWLKQQSSART